MGRASPSGRGARPRERGGSRRDRDRAMDRDAQVRTGRSRSWAALLRQPGARRSRRERRKKEIATQSAPGLAHYFGVAGFLIDQQELDLVITALGKKNVSALRKILPDLAARQCQRL